MRSSPDFGALSRENSPKSMQNKMGERNATPPFWGHLICGQHIYKGVFSNVIVSVDLTFECAAPNAALLKQGYAFHTFTHFHRFHTKMGSYCTLGMKIMKYPSMYFTPFTYIIF